MQVIALADPCTEWDLDRFYYKGKGGRLPVKAEIEKHYSEKTPNFRAADYEDFRVMLDKEKAIDAVLIATPDHLHAYASLVAMRQGKHTYCEKPLTHNIREARLVAQVAQQTGVATQMGNPGHSRDGIRQTCEWIWAGAIGAVREVHSWVPTNRWNPELTGLPQDTAARPGRAQLGPLDRPARAASLAPGLRPGHVARLLGLRHGQFRRFRLPRHGRPLLGARPGRPGERRGLRRGGEPSGDPAARLPVLLPLPRHRAPAGRQADLVRRRLDARTARRLRSRAVQVPPRCAVRGRERIHRLRRRGRTSATGPAGPGGHLRQAPAHA